MRCYSCDRPNSTHDDGDTGRVYCGTCWTIIEDAITKVTDNGEGTARLTQDEYCVTIEELMEEEQGITNAFRERSSDASDLS